MGVVYVIKNNLNGKQYVGSTIRPLEQRIKEHQLANTNSPLHVAIREHGWESFSYEVVFTSDNTATLRSYEGSEMLKRNTFGEDGYNIIGVSGIRSPNTKTKLIAFRAPIETQEYITHYCHVHGVNTSTAIAKLIEFGFLLYLSNKYNEEDV